jgi:SAM-dependent methyltransferase
MEIYTVSDNNCTVHPKEWFETWFDSKYYHQLYQNRDEAEAEFFLNNLIKKIGFEKNTKILDLACGRGRHANFLATKGYQVSGYDLSKSSIEYAKNSTDFPINFQVKDMRIPFGDGEFDVILNLFTSFGYFENEKQNLKVMQNIAAALNNNGLAVIDYLNPLLAKKALLKKETKELGVIKFEIAKHTCDTFIHKIITFSDADTTHRFSEKVMLIYPEQFNNYFELSGLKLIQTFGDYSLNTYQPDTSPRMIMVVRK